MDIKVPLQILPLLIQPLSHPYPVSCMASKGTLGEALLLEGTGLLT